MTKAIWKNSSFDQKSMPQNLDHFIQVPSFHLFSTTTFDLTENVYIAKKQPLTTKGYF